MSVYNFQRQVLVETFTYLPVREGGLALSLENTCMLTPQDGLRETSKVSEEIRCGEQGSDRIHGLDPSYTYQVKQG